MAKINLHDLDTFAEEKDRSVRSLKRFFRDIIYKQGRESYIDANAYEILLPKRAKKRNKKKRKLSPLGEISLLQNRKKNRDKTIQYHILDKKDLEAFRNGTDDPVKQKTTDLKLKMLDDSILVLESKNKQDEARINEILAVELS